MGLHQRAESSGLISLFFCAIAGGVGMFLYLQFAPPFWQMTQRRFMASSTIIAVCGCISFIVGYIHRTYTTMKKRSLALQFRRIFEILALSLVYGATLFVSSFLIFSVINSMMGRTLFTTYITALSAAFAGVAGYITFVQAELMDAKTLAMLLPFFVISGVGTACLTNDNPGWYNNNFSQLGDRTTFAATMFNVTLILGGICIIIVSYFALSELYTTYRVQTQYGEEIRKVHTRYKVPPLRIRMIILAILLMLCAASFIGIGTFRYTPHPLLHDTFARTMALWMFFLIVGLPWWAPQLSKTFFIVSDIGAVIVVILGVVWLKGYTPLTNVEALVGLMFLGWFVVFSRQIAAIEADRIQQQLIHSHIVDGHNIDQIISTVEQIENNSVLSDPSNPFMIHKQDLAQ